LDRNKKREDKNRLREWRRKNKKEAREVAIATQQSTTNNRWKGLRAFFNSPIECQVLELVAEKEVVIIIT
jgi:hypothetical protein